MSKLISYSSTLEKSINWSNISKNTSKISFSSLDTLDWSKIKELHILGSVENENDQLTFLVQGEPVLRNGCYITSDQTWLLILGAQTPKISLYLSKCSTDLKTLDIRFTKINHIDVSPFLNTTRLCLSHNSLLDVVTGINKLENLLHLDLRSIPLAKELDVSPLTLLYSLSIRDTMITNISFKNELRHLNYLDAANSAISKTNFLTFSPNLKILNIGGTHVECLDDISQLKKLEVLNISHTNISCMPNISSLKLLRTINIGFTNIENLNNVKLPENLRSVFLCGTPIHTIPFEIRSLKNLRRLVLSDMTLSELPLWLPELKLEFVQDNRYGINLNNTIVPNIDMGIFTQSRAVIEAWFGVANQDNFHDDTLNESKVVFLGDGGAGKSLTIERLLNGGNMPDDFDGSSTPGISITNKIYKINNNDILVHFWDFGGQEILHSMHRMFLTKRTLYVVLVNARDNTQDERSKYWLNNIKSFANGSPVILVLNQIDQNPNASVNETALRDYYPQLGKILKLSATDFSVEEFSTLFENELLHEIEKMPSVREPFLPAWNLLKLQLQNMPNNYINAEEYAKLSEQCGVEINEEIRNSLLDWFSDLGISFCYHDNSALSNYMVLRPDWITNAIYSILFNCSDFVVNGIIKHEDIHQLLHPKSNTSHQPKSVLKNIVYSAEETEYVLGVIRKFRLSYRLDDDTEFIPMLCDRNEKSIVCDYVNQKDVLEFHMNYSYLPNNVIHRLMVEMRSHLDISNVWLTGAIFIQDNIGLSSLVKTDDNTLKIYVKSDNKLYSANTYLNIIKNAIVRINNSLGLQATETIVYHKDDVTDSYDYAYLIESYEHGNTEVYSNKFHKNIKILDILKQTDKAVTEKNQKLFEDIISATQMLQANKLYWNASEDERNTFIRDILRTLNYYISDQTRSGKSSTGKSAGELDIEIRDGAEKPWAIFEALIINSFSNTNKEKWNEHLSRLLDNYNPIGYPCLFLISYLECPKDKFKDIWLNYTDHISKYSPNNYSLQSTKNHSDPSFYLRSCECVYDRGGLPTTVYHICVRLGA